MSFLYKKIFLYKLGIQLLKCIKTYQFIFNLTYPHKYLNYQTLFPLKTRE